MKNGKWELGNRERKEKGNRKGKWGIRNWKWETGNKTWDMGHGNRKLQMEIEKMGTWNLELGRGNWGSGN